MRVHRWHKQELGFPEPVEFGYKYKESFDLAKIKLGLEAMLEREQRSLIPNKTLLGDNASHVKKR